MSQENNCSDIFSVIRRLYECDALKFGHFKLKSGIESPIYVDLRSIISRPDLFVDLCLQYVPLMNQCRFDLICGVPYTALTMATYLSARFHHPMVMRRKEVKQHGTKQTLEGIFKRGQRVLIIEDLISSGSSILETALVLRQFGLIVTDAIVFLDREQNGINNLQQFDIKVHSCMKFSCMMKYLQEEGHITSNQVSSVINWILMNNCSIPDSLRNQVSLLDNKLLGKQIRNIGYGDRAQKCTNPISKRLFELMNIKQSNLCLAADLTKTEQILKLAKMAGPYIVMLKTHVDIIEDFTMDFIHQLQKLAIEHNFLLFEDRKFADIGQTVAQQYGQGIYKISQWADLVNAHLAPGPGLIKALKEEAEKQDQTRACVLIAQLSSNGNLIPAEYSQEAYKLASKNQDFIIGFISQTKISADPTMIHITPGVRIDERNDNLGQQYTTPEDAIENKGADLIVVGRGITSKLDTSEDEFKQNIDQYRKRGFDAYMNTL